MHASVPPSRTHRAIHQALQREIAPSRSRVHDVGVPKFARPLRLDTGIILDIMMLMSPQPMREHFPPPQQPSQLNVDTSVRREAEILRKVYGEKRDALVSLLAGQLSFLKTEAQVYACVGCLKGNCIHANHPHTRASACTRPRVCAWMHAYVQAGIHGQAELTS
jgi:hypothetical protein